MIRITVTNGNNPKLIVEGRLNGQAALELRKACSGLNQTAAALDLSGVTFADQAGARLLCDLRDASFALEGCSGFLRELLHKVSQEAPGIGGEETELVERLQAGDSVAFEILMRRYGPRMLATAKRLLRNEDDARDAVQEAFVSVFRSIRGFAGDAAIATWLHRIVVNAALMQMRSRRRRQEESIEELLPCLDEYGEWAGQACRAADFADLQDERERINLVRACVDKLPAKYRTVLILRDIEDLDTAEVAGMLHTTPTAIKVRLHRARQALKTLIERAMAFTIEAGSITGPYSASPSRAA